MLILLFQAVFWLFSTAVTLQKAKFHCILQYTAVTRNMSILSFLCFISLFLQSCKTLTRDSLKELCSFKEFSFKEFSSRVLQLDRQKVGNFKTIISEKYFIFNYSSTGERLTIGTKVLRNNRTISMPEC